MKLRPYQSELVVDIYESSAQRVLAVLPTGGGKTPVIAVLARDEPAPTLILAPRVELIRQASDKLHSIGVEHGIILPDAEPTRHRVQVGSIQTVVNRLDKLRRPGLIIPDEAHHGVAPTWAKLFDYYSASRVVGFTATPERNDGRGLGDVFGALVLGPSVPALVEGGYLCPMIVYPPAGDALAVIDKPNITGDIVLHYELHAFGVPAIGFCASVQEAYEAAAVFRLAGWRAAAVHGDSPDRDELLAALGAGRLDVLFSCALIDEGVDIAGVGCIIDLAACGSLSRYLQRAGRAMRPARGKRFATYLDHVGNAFRHDVPGIERQWSLESRRRRAGKVTQVAQCPMCYALHPPASRCPGCGHDYEVARAAATRREIERREGELAALTPGDRRLAHLRAAPLSDLLKAAGSRTALEEIADARGYASGWVDIKARFLRRRGKRGSAGDDFADYGQVAV